MHGDLSGRLRIASSGEDMDKDGPLDGAAFSGCLNDQADIVGLKWCAA